MKHTFKINRIASSDNFELSVKVYNTYKEKMPKQAIYAIFIRKVGAINTQIVHLQINAKDADKVELLMAHELLYHDFLIDWQYFEADEDEDKQVIIDKFYPTLKSIEEVKFFIEKQAKFSYK